ncbi:MAG TPA: SRPBCC family protein [Acidimicrobiales bacterium]|nr:SRPBCC family protein [Acidimicrobiales bacterium]
MTSIQHDRNDQREQEAPDSGRSGPQPHRVKGAHIITERIEVGVPIEDAFEWWTRYDDWHQIFKKESAHSGDGDQGGGDQSDGDQGDGDDDQIKVTAKIGPSRREWTAEITEQDRPHRLSWRATGGVQAHGTTTFHRLADRLTKVMVEIEYRPSGLLETVGNFFRMQRRRVRRDLRLFKNHVELRSVGDDKSAGGSDR